MEPRCLSVDEQYKIRRIAKDCVKGNKELNFSKAYVITLFYYLMQFCNYKIDTIPEEYRDAVQTLYKEPDCSYLHYWSKVEKSKNIYVMNIKRAEIKLEGEDPRCPW